MPEAPLAEPGAPVAAVPLRPVSHPRRSLRRAVLGVPLAGKLVGAHALVAVVAIAAVVAIFMQIGRPTEPGVLALVVASLGAALVTSLVLVRIALRPLHMIETTASRVWRGDLDARVPESLSAAPAVARVGRTFNLALDGFANDRARLRALAAEAFRTGDAERARLGRELHDSAAQTLAAAVYQVSAVRDALAGGSADRARLDAALAAALRLATDALDEVRALAQDAYPRVLDDLGLPAALRALANRTAPRDASRPHAPVAVDVDALPTGALTPDAASALYHAARDRFVHAGTSLPSRPVALRLRVAEQAVVLEIDELGDDVAPPAATLAERVALVGGTVAVVPRVGGTRLTIRVLLDQLPLTSRSRAPQGAASTSFGA